MRLFVRLQIPRASLPSSSYHSPVSQDHVQLICFDLGRVLVSICDDWPEAFARAGVDPPAVFFDPAVQTELIEFSHRHETGHLSVAAFDAQVAALTGLDPHEVEAVCRAWLKTPFPGFETLLDRLEPTGVQTACLSNTNARHWNMIRGQDACPASLPMNRLNHHFTSHLIGVMKPDSAIYEYVEQATGINASGIVFFDDRQDNVESASNRGWQGHHIDHTSDSVVQMTAVLQENGLL